MFAVSSNKRAASFAASNKKLFADHTNKTSPLPVYVAALRRKGSS
jgi:hypothetical protein